MQIIIQARMTSTRLPAKVMLPLGDTCVLGFMLKRLESFRNNIIVATPPNCEAIADLCKNINIKHSVGDEQNVLGRYFHSLDSKKDDEIIIRLTSDCPLICEEILELGIKNYQQNTYLSNTIERTYPRGLDFEIFNYAMLKNAYQNAKTEREIEHVTPFLYSENRYKILQIKDTKDNSHYRLTIDEELDYKMMRELIKKLPSNLANYEEIIQTLKSNQDISLINQNIAQKHL